MAPLALLCAGAAKGLLAAIGPAFTAETGIAIEGVYGAVGALVETLARGAPCDAIVLTAALIVRLEQEGLVLPGSVGAARQCAHGDRRRRAGTSTRHRRRGVAARGARRRDAPRVPRSRARHRGHPLRRRAAPARHCRPRGNALHDLRERRGRDGRACARGRPRRDRLHTAERDSLHPGGRPRGCFAARVRPRSGLFGGRMPARARARGRATAYVELLAGASSRATRERCGFEAVSRVA